MRPWRQRRPTWSTHQHQIPSRCPAPPSHARLGAGIRRTSCEAEFIGYFSMLRMLVQMTCNLILEINRARQSEIQSRLCPVDAIRTGYGTSWSFVERLDPSDRFVLGHSERNRTMWWIEMPGQHSDSTGAFRPTKRSVYGCLSPRSVRFEPSSISLPK